MTQESNDPKTIQWVEREINHPGEYHPVGLLFGGEVQFWVVAVEPEPVAMDDPKRHVVLKSGSGKIDHDYINNWQVFADTDEAKDGAQQYVHDNWDYLLAFHQEAAGR